MGLRPTDIQKIPARFETPHSSELDTEHIHTERVERSDKMTTTGTYTVRISLSLHYSPKPLLLLLRGAYNNSDSEFHTSPHYITSLETHYYCALDALHELLPRLLTRVCLLTNESSRNRTEIRADAVSEAVATAKAELVLGR